MDSLNTNAYVNDRRIRIREVLSQRDQELGELYWTAIEILDPATTQRRRMSAHAIREMTDALPRLIDVPTKSSKQRLGDYVERLIPSWKKARDGKFHAQGTWKGEIDEGLAKALILVDQMIQWQEENRPKRGALTKGFLRKTDPSPLELPGNLQSDRAKEWTNLHDFFVRVAHGANTTEVDFNAHLEQLDSWRIWF